MPAAGAERHVHHAQHVRCRCCFCRSPPHPPPACCTGACPGRPRHLCRAHAPASPALFGPHLAVEHAQLVLDLLTDLLLPLRLQLQAGPAGGHGRCQPGMGPSRWGGGPALRPASARRRTAAHASPASRPRQRPRCRRQAARAAPAGARCSPRSADLALAPPLLILVSLDLHLERPPLHKLCSRVLVLHLQGGAGRQQAALHWAGQSEARSPQLGWPLPAACASRWEGQHSRDKQMGWLPAGSRARLAQAAGGLAPWAQHSQARLSNSAPCRTTTRTGSPLRRLSRMRAHPACLPGSTSGAHQMRLELTGAAGGPPPCGPGRCACRCRWHPAARGRRVPAARAPARRRGATPASAAGGSPRCWPGWLCPWRRTQCRPGPHSPQ